MSWWPALHARVRLTAAEKASRLRRMLTRTRAERESGLVRAIGVRGLAASIVNTTVGAGIFVLPALVARDLGAAAPSRTSPVRSR